MTSSRERDSLSPGRHLGRVLFDKIPEKELTYACRWNGEDPGNLTILVTFDGQEYPFERHCRHAVVRDSTAGTTFANIDFRDTPPGIRVGPWPGWRGIQEFPGAEVVTGEKIIPLQFQFWGDELSQRKIRGICRLQEPVYGRVAVRISDSRLVPAQADFYAVARAEVVSLPLQPSRDLLSRHPRLLLHAEDLPRLRGAAGTERSRSLTRLLADLSRWDLPLLKTAESKIPPGPEGFSEEDRLLVGAFVALLLPNEENQARAVSAFFDYIRRTEAEDYSPLTIDTQAGEVLFLLSAGYDWLHEHLTAQQRKDARRRLWEVADICWNHLGYERQDYAQAHFLGCGMGLLAFSLLFLDEHPRAKEWTAYLNGVLRWVCSTFPPDGFYPHGLNIWIYESGFLLRWLELFRTAGETDLWPQASALAASSRFRAAATSPDGLFGVTMGDPQYRVGGDSWCHYLIAARTGSRVSQWLGDFLRDLPAEGVDYRNAPLRRRVYEHLWFDEQIKAQEPGETFVHFPDGGQLFVRTEKSLFTFRSGSPLGVHRYRAGITGGYGHADPCNGSFLSYDSGIFSISGPGPVYRRDSALHNVVTIDGQGQVGDGAVWLPDFFPPDILPPKAEVRVSGATVAVTADLAPAYLPHLGIRSLRRSLLVWPDRFIIGADLVRLHEPRSVEWNLHSWGEFADAADNAPLHWSIRKGDASPLQLFMFHPLILNCAMGQSDFVPAYPHDGTRDSFLRLSAIGEEVRFTWCLLFSGKAAPAVDQGHDVSLRFSDGMRTIFDGKWITIREGHETEA